MVILQGVTEQERPTRAEMAHVAAVQTMMWAGPAADRFRSASEQIRSRRYSAENGLLGDGLLSIIALERALEAARWVVANRTDAGQMLEATAPMLSPLSQLDDVWWLVKIRRDRISHIRGRLDLVGEFGVSVSRRGIDIAGIPAAFSLVTGTMWATTLRGWSQNLLERPYVDVAPSVIPTRLDRDDWPGWATR